MTPRGPATVAHESPSLNVLDHGSPLGFAVEDAPPSILVVEDDPAVGPRLAHQLAADGYRADLALTSRHARSLAAQRPPALALLGHCDPPRGALELLGEIRRGVPWRANLPVIVLGSSAHYLDLLRAFEAGADDFLARPGRVGANYLELRARLRALLRRAHPRGDERPLRIGPLLVDPRTHTATLHDRPLRLRRLEYRLLVHLAHEPARVFARQELLRAVWGYQAPGATRTLDSHASRLRRALAHDDPRNRWVVNVRGVGYRLI